MSKESKYSVEFENSSNELQKFSSDFHVSIKIDLF